MRRNQTKNKSHEIVKGSSRLSITLFLRRPNAKQRIELLQQVTAAGKRDRTDFLANFLKELELLQSEKRAVFIQEMTPPGSPHVAP